jgi:hypothetical protein
LVAADSVRVQPSMFDRIERIPVDFIPMAGREYTAKTEDNRGVNQCAYDFGSTNHCA